MDLQSGVALSASATRNPAPLRFTQGSCRRTRRCSRRRALATVREQAFAQPAAAELGVRGYIPSRAVSPLPVNADSIDLTNPVVALCAEGMAAEGTPAEARHLF